MVKVKGQGHQVKKRDSLMFDTHIGFTQCKTLAYSVSSYAVTGRHSMTSSIMPKGLWGEGTLQHGLREVRQRSGVFIISES